MGCNLYDNIFYKRIYIFIYFIIYLLIYFFHLDHNLEDDKTIFFITKIDENR